MKHQKGNHVRYAQNGVCLIEDMIKMHAPFDTGLKDFYVLKPVADPSSKIFVPVDNEVLTDRMEYILSKQEVDALIISMKECAIPWIEDRNERLNSFNSILRQCDQQELLRLVSCIYLKKQQLAEIKKPLPSSDEIVLRKAERLIENEFSFILDVRREEVGQYIREKLEISEAHG